MFAPPLSGLVWIRSTFLRGGLGAVLLGGSAFAASSAVEPGPRPNFLVFVTDDESALERGIYGWSGLKTPAFERVAKSGVLFNRAYCSAPSCAPSRAALLTGRNFWELEQGAFIQAYLPSKFPVVPGLLAKAGYHVGWTGKSVGPYQPSSELPKPDRYHVRTIAGRMYNDILLPADKWEKDISRIDYAANFEAFLKDRGDGEPFWFWVGTTEPHSPAGGMPDNTINLQRRHGISTAQVKVPGFWPDTEGLRKLRAAMWYAILHADQALGRILDHLEARGELENTFIIVTSDNGTEPPKSKATAYEWGCHIPMAVSWPRKIPPGRTIDNLVLQADLAPTMLEAAGEAVPPDMTAQSLMPVLLSDGGGVIKPWRTSLVTGLEWHGEYAPHNRAFRTIRDADFAYIVNYGGGVTREPAPKAPADFEKDAARMRSADALVAAYPDHPAVAHLARFVLEKRPPEELYDLKNDPWQLKDLAQDPAYAETKVSLKKQLEDYQRRTADPRATGKMDLFNETREFVIKRKERGYKD